MKTLQVGLDWFPERAGGLPRYYYDLWRASSGVFAFRGLVLGSNRIATETNGAITGFAPRSTALPKKLWRARQAYRAMMQGWAPDVLVSHFALTTLPMLPGNALPLVTQFHGPWAAEGAMQGDTPLQTRIKHRIETMVYRRADRAIVLSRAFAETLARDYGYPYEKIDLIPGGVDIERFNGAESQAEAREELGWTLDRPTVLAIRRLVPRMGLDRLIAAAQKLKTSGRDVLIKIGGTGPLAQSLQRQIDDLELKSHVELLGFVPEDALALTYRAADLVIVPSVALEGFGLTVLEALASGTPVLVAPIGGLPEIVAGLDANMILPSLAPAEIAAALSAALYHHPLTDSDTCRDYARQFDWSLIAQRLRDAYGKAV